MTNKTEKDIVPYLRIPHIRFFIMDIKSRTPHMHEAFELFTVLKGNGTMTLQTGEIDLHSGDVMIVNPNKVHSFHCENDRLLILTIHLSLDFEHDYFPELKNIIFNCNEVIPASSADAIRVIELMNQAALSYFRLSSYDRHRCVALVTMLMSELLERFDHIEMTSSEYTAQIYSSQRMYRIVKYIETHLTEPRLLQSTAQKEGLSSTYLSRLFTEYFNISFQEFLKQKRIEKAMRLLRTTNLPIYDICYECGFQDYRQLNKYCWQTFGQSASKCRDVEMITDSGPITPREISIEYRYSDQETLDYLLQTVKNDRIEI